MLFKISAPHNTRLKVIEHIVSNIAGYPMEASPSPGAVYDDPEKPGHFVWEMQPRGGKAMSEPFFTTYLGDSVYTDFNGYYVRLYTNNGAGPENVIYLEPEVQISLIKFFESLVGKKTQ